MTYVFLDTMIYLHYIWFEDIDFKEVVGDQEVQIVVPHITLHELDTHKDNHRLPKIRERARKVANTFFECFTQKSGALKGALTASEFDESSTFDFAAHNLDKSKNDHCLLAAILEFRDSHTEPVLLITQDIGPRLKANRLGVDAKELSEAYLLPSEEDPLVKENKQLKNEVLKLKSHQPKLSLVPAVTNEGKYEVVVLPPEETIDVDREMEAVRCRYALEMESGKDSPHPYQFTPFSAVRDRYHYQMTDSEYAEKIRAIYKRDWEHYLEKYESYLKNLKQIESRCNVALELKISNSGESPANEVNLIMTFPDEQEVFMQDDPPKKQESPEVPTKRHTLSPQMCIMNRKRDAPNYKKLMHPEPYSLRKEREYTFRFKHGKLSHNWCVTLPTLIISFASYESAGPIQIKYRISADNLPQPTEGELNVIIKKEENK